jgi:hypothetical protein
MEMNSFNKIIFRMKMMMMRMKKTDQMMRKNLILNLLMMSKNMLIMTISISFLKEKILITLDN